LEFHCEVHSPAYRPSLALFLNANDLPAIDLPATPTRPWRRQPAVFWDVVFWPRFCNVMTAEERAMDPECWYCGQPIREGQPSESLPRGVVAVHAVCVQRDIKGGADGACAAMDKAA